jgi:hypothetical protein
VIRSKGKENFIIFKGQLILFADADAATDIKGK